MIEILSSRDATLEEIRAWNKSCGKICRTCSYNDCGLCDRYGRWVADHDTCEKWSKGEW
jgi:hypothetical protein